MTGATGAMTGATGAMTAATGAATGKIAVAAGQACSGNRKQTIKPIAPACVDRPQQMGGTWL